MKNSDWVDVKKQLPRLDKLVEVDVDLLLYEAKLVQGGAATYTWHFKLESGEKGPGRPTHWRKIREV